MDASLQGIVKGGREKGAQYLGTILNPLEGINQSLSMT